MTKPEDTTQAAGGSPLERGGRAHDPERAAFERWWATAYDPAVLVRTEGGSYLDLSAGMAWDAWQAARPPRHEIGRLVNLAAECAQRKPLRALEPLTEVSHIGHRQFARAYAGADEAVRLLAIELRRVADAL